MEMAPESVPCGPGSLYSIFELYELRFTLLPSESGRSGEPDIETLLACHLSPGNWRLQTCSLGNPTFCALWVEQVCEHDELTVELMGLRVSKPNAQLNNLKHGNHAVLLWEAASAVSLLRSPSLSSVNRFFWSRLSADRDRPHPDRANAASVSKRRYGQLA